MGYNNYTRNIIISLVVALAFVGIVGAYYSGLVKSTQSRIVGDYYSDLAKLKQSQPNIVVIMVDDLEEGSFNLLVETNLTIINDLDGDGGLLSRLPQESLMPNLKKYLIDQGTSFNNSFTSTALCCPSRATFLTGQYSHNHGVLDNTLMLNFDDTSTVATWLKGAGYRTGHVGKYLNGYGNNYSASSPKDDPTYIPPGWDDWQALVGTFTYRVYNYTVNDNGVLVYYGAEPQDYQTDVLALRATEFIDESEGINDAQPFFLAVTSLVPHIEIAGPVMLGCEFSKWRQTIRPAPRHIGKLPTYITVPMPPSFNEANVSDKPSWFNSPNMSALDITCLEKQYRDRLEAMFSLDDLIGSIISTLYQNNELANTVIIFTSDNGWFNGEHRLSGKKYGYEESIRVPLVVRAPGFTTPQVSSRYVLNNDLAPTIAQLASATPSLIVDGRSITPLLGNPLFSPWRRRILVESLGNGLKYKFSGVRTSIDDIAITDKIYVSWSDGSKEFYDIMIDPYELASLHADSNYSLQMQMLNTIMLKLQNCAGTVCQQLEDLPYLRFAKPDQNS